MLIPQKVEFLQLSRLLTPASKHECPQMSTSYCSCPTGHWSLNIWVCTARLHCTQAPPARALVRDALLISVDRLFVNAVAAGEGGNAPPRGPGGDASLVENVGLRRAHRQSAGGNWIYHPDASRPPSSHAHPNHPAQHLNVPSTPSDTLFFRQARGPCSMTSPPLPPSRRQAMTTQRSRMVLYCWS